MHRLGCENAGSGVMDLPEDSRMKPGFGMSPWGFALNPEMLLFLVSQTEHAALTYKRLS